MYLTPQVSLGIDWMQATEDRNYSHFAEPRHATDAVTEEGIHIINTHQEKYGADKPMFLYLAYHAGHGPLLPNPRHTEPCKHLTNEWRRDYCGLLFGLGKILLKPPLCLIIDLFCEIDEAIGKVTQHARSVLGDDLVIVVSSDNGASTWEGGLNYPLRSGKFSPFEGNCVLTFKMITVNSLIVFVSRRSSSPMFCHRLFIQWAVFRSWRSSL